MTDATLATVLTAFFTALPATVAAAGAWRQGRRNGRKADASVAAAKTTAEKIDVISQKADNIHELTNSTFDGLKGELATTRTELAIARLENDNLKATIAAMSGHDRRH